MYKVDSGIFFSYGLVRGVWEFFFLKYGGFIRGSAGVVCFIGGVGGSWVDG